MTEPNETEGNAAGAGSAGGPRDLDRALADLRALSDDIGSCAVLSEDGELLGSSHGPGVDRERSAAMVAALVALAGRIAREDGKGRASQVRVKAEGGHVLLVGLEGGGTLVATAGPEARVGLALYDMRNARGEVEGALNAGRGEG